MPAAPTIAARIVLFSALATAGCDRALELNLPTPDDIGPDADAQVDGGDTDTGSATSTDDLTRVDASTPDAGQDGGILG